MIFCDKEDIAITSDDTPHVCARTILPPMTDEEIADAVEKFKNAVADIKAHKFEPTLKESACKYCPYQDFCGMNVI